MAWKFTVNMITLSVNTTFMFNTSCIVHRGINNLQKKKIANIYIYIA
jgi:hypothetical protein